MKTLVLLTFLLPGISLHAVDFEFKAAINSGFATSDGADLPVGNLLRFGVFTLTDSQISENAGNLAFLDAHFTELASAVIGQGNPAGGTDDNDPANAGLFIQGLAAVDTITPGLAGARLSYWVFDSASLGAVTRHGIFSSTTWLIPAGNGAGDDFGVVYTDISDLTLDGEGQVLAGTALILVGGFGPGVNASGGGQDFTLTAIPEAASCSLLAGGAALLCVALRRRRVSLI